VDNFIGGEHLILTLLYESLLMCLIDSLRMLTGTLSQIIGAIVLISIIIPYFLAVAFFIIIFYVWAAYFYRASARELKVGPFDQFGGIPSYADPTAPRRHPAFLPLFPLF